MRRARRGFASESPRDGSRGGVVLTADRALEALRTLGCDYRPDVRVADGAWEARCPRCGGSDRTPRSLRLREGSRGGRVTGGCAFCGPGVLLDLTAALRPATVETRVARLEQRVAELAQEVVEMREACT